MNDNEWRRVCERARAAVHEIPGVVGVGCGPRWKGGRFVGGACIHVMVARKRPVHELIPSHVIPAELLGIPTDVIAVGGRPQPLTYGWYGNASDVDADEGRYRPLRGGVQLSKNASVTSAGGAGTGTMGCLIEDTADPTLVYALTCYHVLFDANELRIPWEVGQPTTAAGSSDCCQGIFGRHSLSGWNADAVLCRLNAGTEWLAEIEEIGVVHGQHRVTMEDLGAGPYQVLKRGRTSRKTGGVVTSIHHSGWIEGGVRAYSGAMLIRPNLDPGRPSEVAWMGLRGDSGSVAVSEVSRDVVGLIFSMTTDPEDPNLPDVSDAGAVVAFPIDDVLGAFAGHTTLRVATATTAGDVRRVPGAAPVAAGGPWPIRQDLDATLRAGPSGRIARELWRRHGEEMTQLVRQNRRVGALWRLNSGPELFQVFVRASYDVALPVAATVAGRPTSEAARAVADVFMRYGSPTLRRDIEMVRAVMPPIEGRSLDDLVRTPTGVSLDSGDQLR